MIQKILFLGYWTGIGLVEDGALYRPTRDVVSPRLWIPQDVIQKEWVSECAQDRGLDKELAVVKDSC